MDQYAIFCFFLQGVHVALSVVVHPYVKGNVTYDVTSSLPASPRQIRWAEGAYAFVRNIECSDVFFTTHRECRRLRRVAKADMNVYLAEPTVEGRLQAVMPDKGLSRTGVHDAVVVLDPYPRANFGHLLLVFYVELGMSRMRCQVEGGTELADGECMIMMLKRRCKNALERRGRRRNFARRCEVNFLPIVYLESDNRARRQRLLCHPKLPGFAACPKLRPANETTSLVCNPIRENTKRCETATGMVQTSCRVFEICDQAVILSGGWNRWTARPHHTDNVRKMYRMLKKNGFKDRNIKVFFANGALKLNRGDGSRTFTAFTAALKMALRYHLQKLCSSPHCVDSLVFYMNSPSRSDGTALLWDVNQDGMAGHNERYKLNELLADVANCQARQVHMIVDQSYSAEIARAVKRSRSHRNVVVYASSKGHEYSWADHFTNAWARANHTGKCSKEVFREAKRKMRFSTPEMHSGEDTAKVTIFGAPCDVRPPFTRKELKMNYLGCQNLPTALWVIKFLNLSQDGQKSAVGRSKEQVGPVTPEPKR